MIRFVLSALALVVAIGCSEARVSSSPDGRPPSGPNVDTPTPQPPRVKTPEPTGQDLYEAEQRRIAYNRQHLPRPAVAPPDVASAPRACRAADGTWRCTSVSPPATPELATAGAAAPIYPVSWSITQWYIDPGNESGAASDNNVGTTTSAPLLTVAGLYNQRWGCVGQGQTSCPATNNNVTVTFLSTQPGGGASDPFCWRPMVRNKSSFVVNGVLNSTTQVSTGTFTAVTAQNRATSTTWTVTTSGGSNPNDLLVDSTHPARFLNFNNLSGGADAASQLYATEPLNPTASVALPAEVAIASGDSYADYTQVGLNVVCFEPQIENNGGGNPAVLQAVTIPVNNDDDDGSSMIVQFGGSLIVADSTIYKATQVTNGVKGFPSTRMVNNYYVRNGQFQGALPPGTTSGPSQNGDGSYQYSAVPQVFGGTFFDIDDTFETSFVNVWLDYDVILEKGGIGPSMGGVVFYGCVQTQGSGNYWAYNAYVFPTTQGACTTNAIWWRGSTNGSASTKLYAEGTTRWSYSGATATNTFLSPLLLRINDLTTACSHNGAAPDVIDCGISLTQANLDAAQSSTTFGGYAFNPGGASITSGL
jgi:hypothetical protein